MLFFVPLLLILDLLFFEWPKGLNDVLIEAHGVIFDLLVFGIVLAAYDHLRQKKQNIKRYEEEIDDFRGWDEKEAMYRIVGNVKRLNKEGVSRMRLSYSYLEKANLFGANLAQANLIETNLNGARLIEADLSEIKLIGTKFVEPFPKGQSGNPKGRSKKLPGLDDLLTEVLGDGNAMERVLRKLLAMAEAGNLRAIEIILDRAYGKSKQDVVEKPVEDMINGRLLADWTDEEIEAELKRWQDDN